MYGCSLVAIVGDRWRWLRRAATRGLHRAWKPVVEEQRVGTVVERVGMDAWSLLVGGSNKKNNALLSCCCCC